jgi:uncharacterized protein (DUF4415 family)
VFFKGGTSIILAIGMQLHDNIIYFVVFEVTGMEVVLFFRVFHENIRLQPGDEIWPLTDKSGEVRELTREDMKRFRPAAEVLPQELLAVLPKRKRGQRGAQKRPTKEPVTIRYSRDVLEYFRTTGPPAGKRALMPR